MRCRFCGGLVLWMGPLTDLQYTECQDCHRHDCQEHCDDLTDEEAGGEDPGLQDGAEGVF